MEITPDLANELTAAAHAAADAAATETMRLFRNSELSTQSKSESGFDPVTQADRAAETVIRDVLGALRPDDAVLGEEFDAASGESGITWVVDPIDGTRAYICGAPTWGTLIAADDGDGPILGLIDQPFTGERFWGGFGASSVTRHMETRDIATRPCATLSQAVLCSTYPEIGTDQERLGFETVRDRTRLTRYGLDCYAYALVAMGQIDLVIEAGLQPYDIQGPMAVVRGAGGLVTNWRGGPAHRGGRVIAAGDPRVHAEVVELLSRVSD